MIGAGSLEIPPEPLVLIDLILPPQFASHSEIDERELDSAIDFHAGANVFQLQVTVGVFLLMDDFQGLD